MLLRNLYEDKKTAIAAFGRMNPPTIGHAKLVDKIKSINGDHYLFLSQTQKPKDNPLPFDVKLQFAKQFFPGVNVGHPSVRTPIQMLQMLEKLGYTDIIYVAGSDRVDSFEKLFNDYNGKEYNFNSIRVISAGERDPDADGAEGMSASKMRAAAASGNLEAFAQGTPDKKLAQKMYDAVRKGMGVKEPVEEQQLNELAFVPALVPVLSFAARQGAKYLLKTLTKQGIRKAAGVVAKNTGKAAVETGKAIVKRPVTTGLAYVGYETYDSIEDAIVWLEENFPLDKAMTSALASAMVKYALPAAAVVAIIMGGKYLYDYMNKNKPEEDSVQDKIKNESDVVLDKTSVRSYIRNLIIDKIDKENDIEKLSKILKYMVGKEVKTRGSRYQITSEDIIEACASMKRKRRGRA